MAKDGNSLPQFDFLSALASTRQALGEDVSSSGGKAVNLPPIFETTKDAEARENRYVEKDVDPSKVGIETYYDAHSEVFVLYRPWEKCKRCRAQIDTGEIVLPSDQGDYTCKHTQLEEYLQCVNTTLNGSALLTLREHYMTMDGVRRAHVEWLTPNEEKRKEIEREQKKKRASQVYPPDVEAAFKKEDLPPVKE